jgi:hypothetical protein
MDKNFGKRIVEKLLNNDRTYVRRDGALSQMSEDYTRERVIGSLSDDLRVFIQKGESDT